MKFHQMMRVMMIIVKMMMIVTLMVGERREKGIQQVLLNQQYRKPVKKIRKQLPNYQKLQRQKRVKVSIVLKLEKSKSKHCPKARKEYK